MADRSVSDDRKLFVRGLADDIDQDTIKETFSKFGSVTEVLIPLDHETQQSKGYAFITFENLSDCEEACREMHGKDFQGKALVVEAAIAKRFKAGFRGGFHDRGYRGRGSSFREFSRSSRGRLDRQHSSRYRDFDNDRQRSDFFSHGKSSRGSGRPMDDEFRTRRSPVPRNYGHLDRSPVDRRRASDQLDYRMGYEDDRDFKSERRYMTDDLPYRRSYNIPHDRDYNDRRQNEPMMRSSPSRHFERYSSRGRQSSFQMEHSRFPSGSGYGDNIREPPPYERNRNDFSRRAARSTSPPEKVYRMEGRSRGASQRLPRESYYPRGDRQGESSGADAMRRRVPPFNPASKRMRMEDGDHAIRASGHDTALRGRY